MPYNVINPSCDIRTVTFLVTVRCCVLKILSIWGRCKLQVLKCMCSQCANNFATLHLAVQLNRNYNHHHHRFHHIVLRKITFLPITYYLPFNIKYSFMCPSYVEGISLFLNLNFIIQHRNLLFQADVLHCWHYQSHT